MSFQSKFGFRKLYFAGEHTAEAHSLAPYSIKLLRYYFQRGKIRQKLKIYLQTWWDLVVTYLLQYGFSEIFIYSSNVLSLNLSSGTEFWQNNKKRLSKGKLIW